MKLLTQEEYQKITRKRHKYNVADAAERTYDGIVFDSKREMEIYQGYALLLKAGELIRLDRQVRYPIVFRGKHICNVIIDFKLIYANGWVEAVEVKGVETTVWKLKKKLLMAMYPKLVLRVVK